MLTLQQRIIRDIPIEELRDLCRNDQYKSILDTSGTCIDALARKLYALYRIPEWYFLDSPIEQTPFQRYFEVATQIELSLESIYNPETGEGVYLPIGAFLEGIKRRDEEFLQWLLPKLSTKELDFIELENTQANLSGRGKISPDKSFSHKRRNIHVLLQSKNFILQANIQELLNFFKESGFVKRNIETYTFGSDAHVDGAIISAAVSTCDYDIITKIMSVFGITELPLIYTVSFVFGYNVNRHPVDALRILDLFQPPQNIRQGFFIYGMGNADLLKRYVEKNKFLPETGQAIPKILCNIPLLKTFLSLGGQININQSAKTREIYRIYKDILSNILL